MKLLFIIIAITIFVNAAIAGVSAEQKVYAKNIAERVQKLPEIVSLKSVLTTLDAHWTMQDWEQLKIDVSKRENARSIPLSPLVRVEKILSGDARISNIQIFEEKLKNGNTNRFLQFHSNGFHFELSFDLEDKSISVVNLGKNPFNRCRDRQHAGELKVLKGSDHSVRVSQSCEQLPSVPSSSLKLSVDKNNMAENRYLPIGNLKLNRNALNGQSLNLNTLSTKIIALALNRKLSDLILASSEFGKSSERTLAIDRDNLNSYVQKILWQDGTEGGSGTSGLN